MELSIVDIIVRLALGAGIGFFIGLTGIGGGVLVLPALTVILGLPASVAVGTANLYAFFTKIFATYQHLKLKTIDLRLSLVFMLGAVPGTLAAALWINKTVNSATASPESIADFQNFLRIFIASVVLISGIILIANRLCSGRGGDQSDTPSVSDRLNHKPFLRKFMAVTAGVIVGGLIGATSVGGGVLVVPMLMIVFGLSSSRTVGTSIFIAVVLTLTASLVYGKGSQMDYTSALTMLGGSILCVRAGSRLAAKLPEKKLQNLVIAVIILAAASMFAKG